MELGFVGLGRMGSNMVQRLLRGGHRIVAHDRSAEPVTQAEGQGAVGAKSLKNLVTQLTPPRTVWLMVPEGEPTESTIRALIPLLSHGDTIVDGGNSYYRDSMRRGALLKDQGLCFVDVGTSGGIWGLREGYSLMIGGEIDAVERLQPIVNRHERPDLCVTADARTTRLQIEN